MRRCASTCATTCIGRHSDRCASCCRCTRTASRSPPRSTSTACRLRTSATRCATTTSSSSKPPRSKMEQILRAAGATETMTIQRFAHLVGGCRMAKSEKDGVVDANQRTFAVPNLYLTDGSVLPTQGSANPALTIMALAARVADHLSGHLVAESPLVESSTSSRSTCRRTRSRPSCPRPTAHSPGTRRRLSSSMSRRARACAASASPTGIPRWSTSSTETLVPKIVGLDVRDTGAAWSAMVRSIRNLGRPGIASMAISAVDLALWDAKARVFEQPLHRVLGAIRNAVPIYGSGGFTTYTMDELLTQLAGWVNEGIPRVKMKIGTDWGVSWRDDVDSDRRRAQRHRGRRRAVRRCERGLRPGTGPPTRRAVRRTTSASPGLRSRSVPTISPGCTASSKHCLSMSQQASTATTSTTFAPCSRPAPSTSCRPTSGGAAESPNGCALPRWPLPTTCRSPVTADRRSICTQQPCHPTFAILSTSTTTCASRTCCSTASSNPDDGTLTPSDAPGNGYTLKTADAAQYRVK